MGEEMSHSVILAAEGKQLAEGAKQTTHPKGERQKILPLTVYLLSRSVRLTAHT